MEQYECPCKGANENCFRCFGTGMTNSRPTVTLASLADISARERQNRTPELQVKVTSRRKRRETPHTPVVNNTTSTKSIRNKTICPICEKWVKVGTLRAHVKQTHPTQYRKAHNIDQCIEFPLSRNSDISSSDEATLPNLAKFELTQCPYCNSKVKKLEKHIKNIHRKVPITATKNSAISQRKYKQENLSQMQVIKQEKINKDIDPNSAIDGFDSSMDESHRWGSTFRDNGRFGSHPSFDGMGDESSP